MWSFYCKHRWSDRWGCWYLFIGEKMEFFEEWQIKSRWFLMRENHRIWCVLLFFIERNKRYPKLGQASLWVLADRQLRACFQDGFRRGSNFCCGGTQCTGRLAGMYWVIILMWNNPFRNLVYGSQIILEG